MAARKARAATKSSASRTVVRNRKKAGTKASATAVQSEALRQFVRAKGAQFLEDPNITSLGVAQKSDGSLYLEFTVAAKASTPEALEGLGTKQIPKYILIGGQQVPT